MIFHYISNVTTVGKLVYIYSQKGYMTYVIQTAMTAWTPAYMISPTKTAAPLLIMVGHFREEKPDVDAMWKRGASSDKTERKRNLLDKNIQN